MHMCLWGNVKWGIITNLLLFITFLVCCDRDRKRMYRIHFTILPRKCYSDKLHMKQKEIVKRIEKELIGRIVKAAQKVMDKRTMEEPAE